MLYYVNAKDLLQTEGKEIDVENGSYWRETITTPCKVLRGKDTTPKYHVITQIKSESKNCDFVEKYANIRTIEGKSGSSKVYIDSSEKNRESYIAIIAIPFNGFAESIPESNDFRIYRGMIFKSDARKIMCNGKAYKKVLYLIVEVNSQKFDPEHKYHADELHLNFTSYNLETKNDVTNTVKTDVVVTFTENNVTYEESVTEVEPVNPEDFKGKNIFTIFKKGKNDREKKPVDKFNKKSDNGTSYNKNKKSRGKGNR